MISAWLKLRPEPQSVKKVFSDLFDQFVPPTLAFLQRNLKTPIPIEDTSVVSSLLKNLGVRFVASA